MESLFREKSIKIRIYMGTEILLDPFEKNVEVTELPSLPIRAIVTDLVFSQISWKMPGIVADKAKEIIVEKKYNSLIEKSYKIQINGENYLGWKQNDKMQIREEGDYIRCYVYIKQT